MPDFLASRLSGALAEVEAVVGAAEMATRLAERDYSAALVALDTHDRAAPNGPLRAEARSLRLRALRESGRTEEATALEREAGAQSP